MSLTARDIANTIDHTLLKPEATPAQVDKLCEEAVRYGFCAVCVNPMYVATAVHRLEGMCAAKGRKSRPAVASVIGFPLGATRSDLKGEEARRALDDGATELDMVIPLGLLIAGDKAAVRKDIEAVTFVAHRAATPALVKVIIESAALTDEQVILACRLSAEAEADFVKTSTGFHPSGGATLHHVQLMHKHAAPIRVKASGGIRDAASAVAMLEAGASRLGCSSGVAIMRELADDPAA